jgi:hypothetical protein
MAVLYCIGIPVAALYMLNSKKDMIQELQIISESLVELDREGTVIQHDFTDDGLDDGADPLRSLASHEGREMSTQRRKSLRQRKVVLDAKRFATRTTNSVTATTGLTSKQAEVEMQKEDLIRLEIRLKEEDPV